MKSTLVSTAASINSRLRVSIKSFGLFTEFGTCGLSVTTFFHQVLNYYYLTVYIMFKPKMSLCILG